MLTYIYVWNIFTWLVRALVEFPRIAPVNAFTVSPSTLGLYKHGACRL